MGDPWAVNDPSPPWDELHLSLTLSLSALLQPLKRPAVISLWTQGSDGKHTLINSMYYSCRRPERSTQSTRPPRQLSGHSRR